MNNKDMYRNYRRKFFFEQWGRESYYLLTSGLLQRLNAREDETGKIILPENHYICDFDSDFSKKKYESKSNLHIVILHGINEYKRKRSIINNFFPNKNIHIHYVGKFDYYWNNIENSNILYPFSRFEFEKNLIKIKEQFPNLYNQQYRRFLITLNNLKKNVTLFSKFTLGSPKIIYFGNIVPKNEYLENISEKFNISLKKLNVFFEKVEKYENLSAKIKIFSELKDRILQKTKSNFYPDLLELFNIIIRNVLCEYLKSFNNIQIYDGKYKNRLFFNAYESYFGKQHTYLDFGVKIGYDEVYPRVDEIIRYKNNGLFFLLDENFFFFDKIKTYQYLEEKINSFLELIKNY